MRKLANVVNSLFRWLVWLYSEKDGEWHECDWRHGSVRRWDGKSWEYREMTQDEYAGSRSHW